ncbi:hypothetical protein ACG0Z6_01025 [Roseateles sp. BYS180W]|uniref:Uncharacterized protein n=1 Tax=Roseateles rivi TaxID=3299028 RepID=A0ABW7FR69_9BURK
MVIVKPQMLFRIEYIAQKARPAFLFARQIEAGNIQLSPSSCLGGVPIRQHLSQPRTLKPDGSPDLTVFAFTLVTANDLPKLSVGQHVELSNDYSQGVGDAA